MHLDKLLSWDDMRDSAQPSKTKRSTRLAESEYYTEQRHDVFARVQIQEISENGEYQPVEVIQTNSLDTGTFQLHQGLQRRMVLSLTHSSSQSLEWKDVVALRVGRIILLDHTGKASNLDTPQVEVPLKLASAPVVRDNSDGTRNITLICLWDSSTHASPLLDRTTFEKHRIQITLLWNVVCGKLSSPMSFTMDLALQIRPRSYVRPSSILQSFLGTTRIVHSSTGIFSVAIRPLSAKRAADLWRMNSKHDYVKGEEMLHGWIPRGVSLVQDYINSRRQRRRVAEIETARSILGRRAMSTPTPPEVPTDIYDERQQEILRKVLRLWTTKRDPEDVILAKDNIEPPSRGAAFASQTNGVGALTPTLIATVRHIPKNPTVLKAGYLMTPDPSHTRWLRRYVELRRPYLHIYSVPDGDEINAINLTNSRIDHQPQLTMLLRRNDGNVVWAIFAPQNTYLFRARSERDKVEWILKIDESYFGSPGNGSGYEEDDEGEDGDEH